jgi:hypothetical protein
LRPRLARGPSSGGGLWNHMTTSWATKATGDYDKMVAKQAQRGVCCLSRRKDPTAVACVHRLKFAQTDDGFLALTGKLLALIVIGEKPTDFSGP